MKVLHKYKVSDHDYAVRPITRSIAIRQFCIECMGWQAGAVLACPSHHCVLYPYRMGPGNTDCTVENTIKRSLKLSPEGK